MYPGESDESEREAFSLRLHLIRHGETESNYAGLVLGQSDSPLTERGVEQATEAGVKLNFLNDTWLFYSSDLGRAQSTALFISDRANWKWDVRLRELGKGAREGHPKDLSYYEALTLLNEESQGKNCTEPLLESEEDAMTRFHEWVQVLLRQCCDSTGGESKRQSSLLKHVIAVSHSGMIRTIVQHLFPQEILLNAELDVSHSDGKRRLKVPNLSHTIIDIIPDQSSIISSLTNEQNDFRWHAKLKMLADVSHLSDHLIS